MRMDFARARSIRISTSMEGSQSLFMLHPRYIAPETIFSCTTVGGLEVDFNYLLPYILLLYSVSTHILRKLVSASLQSLLPNPSISGVSDIVYRLSIYSNSNDHVMQCFFEYLFSVQIKQKQRQIATLGHTSTRSVKCFPL